MVVVVVVVAVIMVVAVMVVLVVVVVVVAGERTGSPNCPCSSHSPAQKSPAERFMLVCISLSVGFYLTARSPTKDPKKPTLSLSLRGALHRSFGWYSGGARR